MRTRILTGLSAFIIFLPFLIFSDTIAFPIAMAICSVVSVFEMIHCVGLHKNPVLTVPLCLVAAATPVCLRLLGIDPVMAAVPGAILVFLLYVLAITTFSKGKLPVTESSTVLMTSIYIIAGFAAMVYLRDFHEGGKYIYLLTFIGAWVPDTFAYFTGMLFGKHKLIPDVSPKKTVEGAVSGIFGAVAACLIYGLLIELFTEVSANYLSLAIIGLILSFISQLGDLAASLIKREYGVKDYGSILPGHGGIMDRFDSVLAVSTPLMAICILLPPFN